MQWSVKIAAFIELLIYFCIWKKLINIRLKKRIFKCRGKKTPFLSLWMLFIYSNQGKKKNRTVLAPSLFHKLKIQILKSNWSFNIIYSSCHCDTQQTLIRQEFTGASTQTHTKLINLSLHIFKNVSCWKFPSLLFVKYFIL